MLKFPLLHNNLVSTSVRFCLKITNKLLFISVCIIVRINIETSSASSELLRTPIATSFFILLPVRLIFATIVALRPLFSALRASTWPSASISACGFNFRNGANIRPHLHLFNRTLTFLLHKISPHNTM